MKWLYRIISLLYGCRHKLVIVQQLKVFEAEWSELPCETKFILKCTKCGDIKKKVI